MIVELDIKEMSYADNENKHKDKAWSVVNKKNILSEQSSSPTTVYYFGGLNEIQHKVDKSTLVINKK